MTDDDPVSATAATVAVQVFGGMSVIGVDGPVSIGGPRQRRLLALLALRAGSVASNDWLAEHLWNDAERPDAQANRLRTYVSRLRQSLPQEAQAWISTESAGYRLDAPELTLEHRRFAHLRAQARTARGSGDPLTALTMLDEALALWRGDPFQELDESNVARAEVEQLRLDRLEMLEERWECSLALGRHTQITGELAVFTSEHRLRDRSTRQYALALHRSGRTAEALRSIAEHRQLLADESGLDPSTEMVELEQAMLAGDGALDVEKIGRPLRGYRLLDEIGSGAFSIVWRAMQPSVGREVAIKQIRSELASQPEFIRRFEAEAHLIARIEHPHIVPLIDFWRDPDSAYLVMRLLRGDTLERRLDGGPLAVDETLTLAHQIGGALSAAHAHGVIHRDVKTSNIMFDESGNAFLGDFGIALEATDSTGPGAAFSTGSPAYSAPEQIRREPLGPQADVFSLGVVLFESITGTLPFTNSETLALLVERQLHTDYPLVTDLQPDIPRHVATAIAKATTKKPDDRYSSVAAFLSDLDPGETLGVPVEEAVVGLATNLPNPYLGLRTFDEADRDNFFGREALTNTLLTRLGGTGVTSRCIGVVGPSGSGKSSVVRAGLSPALRAGAIKGSAQWFATTMVPGTNPFESLEAALLRIAVNPPTTLLDQLQDGPRGLLRCLRRCLSDDTNKIYLVIDQFEEIFTSTTSQMASDFLHALAVAVEDPQSPLRLVFTLRADYYGHPLEHPGFARILDATSVSVTPLTADELERAMVEPARRLGVGFEPGLVALIVADCIGQPGPLPLLQHALSELFERRDNARLTIAVYEDMGRLTGALAGRAETIHNQATEAQQAAIRRMFGRLISPSEETADLRRRVPVTHLGDDAVTAWVLDQFGGARLITFDRDPASREPTAEVAHEALLREWPRLTGWLNEDRELLRSSEAIALAADAWQQSGNSETDLYRGVRLENALALSTAAPDRLRAADAEFIGASQQLAEAERDTEQGRVRRLRRMLAGIGAALVLALLAGGVAFNQQRRASDQADLAETQAELADEQAQLAQDSAREAEAQAALADEQTLVARGAEEEAQAQAEIADQQAALAAEATAQAELANLITTSGAVSNDDEELSMLLALEANRRYPGSNAEQAVVRALASSTLINRVSALGPPQDSPPAPGCEAAGDVYTGAATEFFVSADQLISRDTLTGSTTEHGPPPGPCVLTWLGNSGADRRVAYSPEGKVWLGSFDGPWDVERELGHLVRLARFSAFNPAHRLLFVATQDGRDFPIIVDDITGDAVGPPINGPGELGAQAVSPDGAFVVLGFDGEAGGESGVTIVIEAETGAELYRSAGMTPAVFGFDAQANELFVGTDDGSVVIVDLPTGDVISTIKTAATSPLLDVGVRSDGAIVVTSTNQAEVIDRQTGATGETIKMTNRSRAELRADGTVFTINGAETRVEIYSLDNNAVAHEPIEFSEPGRRLFGNGLAVRSRNTFRITSIDLATGDEVSLQLITTEGDPFVARVAFGVPGGILAVSKDGHIARWEEGVMVERIMPWGQSDAECCGIIGVGDGTVLLEATTAPGSSDLRLFTTDTGELAQVAVIAADEVVDLAIDDAGGVHVFSSDGIVRSFDQNGAPIGETDTGLKTPAGKNSGAAVTEDHLAFGSVGGGVIIERATGQVSRLPEWVGAVHAMAFAHDGAMLVVSSSDGTLRAWNVEDNVELSVLWRGSPADQFGLWVDEETDSVWIADPTGLVNVPLDFGTLLSRACEIVGRDLTSQEWDLYVPGDEPLKSACDDAD